MNIKYFLLAFLAIQAVNGGVIKQYSHEQDYENLIDELKFHTRLAKLLVETLETGYASRSHTVVENAKNISLAAEIVVKQAEQIFNAECFDGVQNQLALAKDDLAANNEECINNTQLTVNNFIEKSVYYGNGANNMVGYLKENWSNCGDDESCQNDVYYHALANVSTFSVEFLAFKRKVDRLVYGEFEELTICVRTYYKKVYLETLVGIVKTIQKCLEDGQ